MKFLLILIFLFNSVNSMFIKAYFDFNSHNQTSLIVQDKVGNWTGTLEEGATIESFESTEKPESSLFGDALSLGSTSNSRMVIDSSFDFQENLGGFVSFWFYMTRTATGDWRLVSKADGTSNSNAYFQIALHGRESLTRLRYRLNDGVDRIASFPEPFQRNHWYHVVAGQANYTVQLFIDAGLVLQTTAKRGYLPNTQIPMGIGNSPAVAADPRGMHGLIDDLIFYQVEDENEIFSPQRVALIYNGNPMGVDWPESVLGMLPPTPVTTTTVAPPTTTTTIPPTTTTTAVVSSVSATTEIASLTTASTESASQPNTQSSTTAKLATTTATTTTAAVGSLTTKSTTNKASSSKSNSVTSSSSSNSNTIASTSSSSATDAPVAANVITTTPIDTTPWFILTALGGCFGGCVIMAAVCYILRPDDDDTVAQAPMTIQSDSRASSIGSDYAAVSLGESNFAQSFKSTRDLSAQSQEYGNVLATNDATYTSMPGSDGEDYGTIPMPL